MAATKRLFALKNFEKEQTPSASQPQTRWVDRLFSFTKRFAREPAVTQKDRPLPIPLETYVSMAGSIDKTPVMQLSWKFMRDMVYTSDLLSLVVRTKTNETFRNGVELDEQFQSKCLTCEREFDEEKLFCPFDEGEVELPDYDQWKSLNSFIKRSNRMDESLLRVMREVDTDLHIGDNGWLYLERDYEFGEDGLLAKEEVNEVIRMDPNMMRLIMSRYGMGTSEMGSYAYFCTEHRQEVLEKEEVGEYFCEKCHKQLLPAWYMALTKAERIYYGPKEVYHIKLYSNAQGYGVTPLLAVYMKVNTLLRMDKFVLEAYSLQRSPQALLLLRGKRDTIHRGWEWLMQKSRENPNMVWPLVVEGDESKNNRVIEYQPFDLKPIEWSWGEMRQEFRNVVGAVYGVQPIFSSGAQQATGGLANEGLQLAVTSLAIKQSQHVWNDFLYWLSEQLGASDYHYKLNPNEQEDELRDLEVEQKRISIAQQMTKMGYGIQTSKDSKGRLQFDFEEREASELMPTADMLPEEGASQMMQEEPMQEEQPIQMDIPPLTDARTLEEQRQAQMRETRRDRAMTNVPRKDYAPVQHDVGGDDSVKRFFDAIKARKGNYKSHPKGKIRHTPRGDEDATPNGDLGTEEPQSTATGAADAAHYGGMG